MTKKSIDYRALDAELQDVVNKLDASDLDVDEAIALYERGMEIVEQLETYLKDAENKIEKIKADFST